MSLIVLLDAGPLVRHLALFASARIWRAIG